jgi:thiol-disulfide isomerase/thioredoxin
LYDITEPSEEESTRMVRSRVARLTAAALCLLVLGVASVACSDATDEGATTDGTADAADDDTLPAIELVPLEGGETTTLDRLVGTPLVVNLWASWCAPCRREMPDFEAVHQQVGEQVAFVGLTDDPDLGPARELAASTGVTYPLYQVTEAGDLRELEPSGLPMTLFVDAEGRIVERHAGALTAAELNEKIGSLYGLS